MWKISSEGDVIWQLELDGQKPGDSPALGNNYMIIPTYRDKFLFKIN